MSRKKKIINNTSFPDYAIEAFARSIWPDLLAFFESEEGQQEFAKWKEDQEKKEIDLPSVRQKAA